MSILLYERASEAALLFNFFSPAPSPPEIYTLSLHDALPISGRLSDVPTRPNRPGTARSRSPCPMSGPRDRKSTRLNSSHANTSYAVFCLKKKNAGGAGRRVSVDWTELAVHAQHDRRARLHRA